MPTPIITVESVSKRYVIGHQAASADGLRHVLDGVIRNPVGWLANRRRMAKEAREEFWALRDVSFEIDQGDVVGIIGSNGAGKSTLLKVLSRITEPTSGCIRGRGRIASLLEVGTGFHQDLTGRENVFLNGAILGMTRAEIKSKFDEIVAFAEIERFIDTPVKRYSSGMYVRLAFAVAAHLEPEILVVDEVLAVGDAAFQRKCMGRMGEVARRGRTVLFVSHNMAAIRHLCSKGVVLQKGRLSHAGSSESAIAFYHSTLRPGANRSGNAAGHVLYDREPNSGTQFAITRIELLDALKRPIASVHTMDKVTFRIHYTAPRPVSRAAVVFSLSSAEGTRLLLLSTQPDGTLELDFSRGPGVVDLSFPEMPLAAGVFTIGAGLAIPNLEWLCWTAELCELNVLPRDVYVSGLAPVCSRCLLAVAHKWEVPVEADAREASRETTVGRPSPRNDGLLSPPRMEG
jgi:lipopolysaccharide transport system ATP-binding protein